MVGIVSAKKRKKALLEELNTDSLKEICRLERCSDEGTREEILDRVVSKLNLKKTRDYAKKMGISEEFDLFKHDLVPKHRIINQDEKKALLEKYSIGLRDLPRIRVRDPASIAVGAKVGDVLEVIRKSETAGEIKYYRLVVRRPLK